MKRSLPLLALLCLCTCALAHESRPGYLEIQEQPDGQYSVNWKVPRQGDMVLSISPVLPAECRDLVEPARALLPDSLLLRRSVHCGEAGLQGREIRIDGLATSITDVLVRVSLADGNTQTVILKPDQPAFVVVAGQSTWEVFRAYLVLGIEHILFGLDHLLFVLGLLLLVREVGLLIKTITGFTVAHSLTLAAATVGWVEVPRAPVEAVIALSILFLAMELARQHDGDHGLTAREPWLVALSFGLLHGFGFAGALADVGLPVAAIPLALFSFNVGVEAGQLMFVAVALLIIAGIRRLPVAAWPRWAELAPAYVIGSLAAFWCVQRVSAF